MSSAPVLLGLASLLAGLAVLAGVGLTAAADRRAVNRSLVAISGGPALRQRGTSPRALVLPALEALSGVGRVLAPAGTCDRLTRQLDLAGNPGSWTLPRLLAVKALLAIAVVPLGFLLLSGSGLAATVLLTALAAVFAFHLPDLLVHNSGSKRQLQIQKTLPDAIDLLTITVEAGLGFDAALAQVAKDTDGPLAGEFSRVIQEMKMNGRAEAFRALSARTTVNDLASFVSTFVQADKLGIPIGRVLREQSKEMRLKRRQRAEEQAMKVPVKILLPMVVFILPVLFVMVLAPAGMQLGKLTGG